MLDKKRYELLREKYGAVSSWAIWASAGATPKSNVGDLSIFRRLNLLEQLNPNYVFVGLNVSGDGTFWENIPDWCNFHSPSTNHNDYKLRYALENTPYWGAYMTDVIKHHSNTDGNAVMKYLRNHPEVVSANIAEFKDELSLLGTGNPILVAMGDKVYKLLQDNLGTEYTIVPIKHYSYTISKENYREEVISILNSLS